MSDIYTSRDETIYLALVFHQHQPFYVDNGKDFLLAPWVRTHATKDYYRIPRMVQKHPNVHITINLTPLSVEFCIVDLLPRTKIKTPVCNRNDYFMMN